LEKGIRARNYPAKNSPGEELSGPIALLRFLIFAKLSRRRFFGETNFPGKELSRRSTLPANNFPGKFFGRRIIREKNYLGKKLSAFWKKNHSG
jgi:hypothetical protein